MDVFENTNAAPFEPRKIPYKSTTIRIPKNDELLARQPRSDLLCTACDKSGYLICSACHQMRYCSIDCQRLDRSTHKFFCKSFERFTDDKRPSPHHIRAIVFRQHKKKPEWKWVLRNDDRTAVCLSPLYEHLPTDGLTKYTPVMYMSCTIERVAQHWLFSLCLDQESEGEDKSMTNESVLNLGPPGHLMTYWGPILVVGGMPEMAPSTVAQHPEYPMITRLEDVSMNDTSFVIEAVLYGDNNSPCVVNVPRYPYPSLPALKVNCVGDCFRFHEHEDRVHDLAAYESTVVYETVTVPNKEELDLARQYPCILPFLLGLPWLCRRVFNSFPERDEGPRDFPRLPSMLSNSRLGRVHCGLKQHGSQLAGVPGPEPGPKQPANIVETRPPGTVVLVHVFGEPILLEHLQVFNLFEMMADLDNWWKPGNGYKTFNQDLFRKFWDERKRKNDLRRLDLTNVPSPYAWLNKPRQEDKYVKGFAQYESLLADTVTDVYFDNVFRGGRANPWAGGSRDWTEYFDPLN